MLEPKRKQPVFQYDRSGRLKYDPILHFAEGELWTDRDLEYLCRFHEVDELRTISFALGKTEGSCSTMLRRLKQAGRYEYYKTVRRFWC